MLGWPNLPIGGGIIKDLSFTQPKQKKKKKRGERKRRRKKNILPWLFHLIGIPTNFEVLVLRLN